MIFVFAILWAFSPAHNLVFYANLTGKRPASRLPSIFDGARGSNSKT